MQVAHEFELIMQSECLEEKFVSLWEKYLVAIAAYANASRNKPLDLKRALREDGKSRGVFV